MIEFITGFVAGVLFVGAAVVGWIVWQAVLVERESCGEEYHEKIKRKRF